MHFKVIMCAQCDGVLEFVLNSPFEFLKYWDKKKYRVFLYKTTILTLSAVDDVNGTHSASP